VEIEGRLAVVEARMEERDKFLALQAKEYARRLDELNHAHANAVERNSLYVTRETWEAGHRELVAKADSRFDSQGMRLSTIENRLARIIGIGVGIGFASGVLGGGIVALVMRLLK
jgi:hypothetical protein